MKMKRIQLIRLFSSIPKNFNIPINEIEFSASRSSGPGGQNVNKVNTKAEIRFQVETAEWLPYNVRQRLKELQSNKINKNGEIIITSQEHRTQSQNRDDCIVKLKEYLEEAFIEPKERKIWDGIGEITKDNRRKDKLHRSKVKSSRGHSKYDDY